MVGEKIRRLRKQRKLTISELAKAAGLSSSGVSQIERGVIEPSLGTLRSIAGTLDVPVFSLLVDPSKREIVVRAGQRQSLTAPGHQVTHELLTPDPYRRVEVILSHVEPGASSAGMAQAHGGDECTVILQGEARFEVADEVYTLQEGDSIYLDEGVPHKCTNVGDNVLVVISSISPARF